MALSDICPSRLARVSTAVESNQEPRLLEKLAKENMALNVCVVNKSKVTDNQFEY